ncbi:MAG: thioredoxin domain-containing protein, partial [Hyphomonadaceae bacterium]
MKPAGAWRQAMFAGRRRLITLAIASLFLAACQQGGPANTSAESDMALGDPSAKVTVIEYASVTCSHCKEFHAKVWPQLKANYVDTKKIRFVFREFPTAPAQIAVAGFQVARCAGDTPEKYISVLDTLLHKQEQIIEAP